MILRLMARLAGGTIVVLAVTAIVRPPRAIGGAKGCSSEYTIATKSPRGFNYIIILRCVGVVVKRDVGPAICYLHLRFVASAGLEGANPEDALQVMSLERIIELDEEGLWHDGLVELLSRRNEFEFVGVVSVTLECP